MSHDLPIVNALGILDNPNSAHSLEAASQLNPTSDQFTIDERALSDAHASGLTAVNVTLGYTMGEMEPYPHTLREIATWDRIVAEHPADLVKVLAAADIDQARADRRIGIIYGFQNAVAVGDDPGRVAELRTPRRTGHPAHLQPGQPARRRVDGAEQPRPDRRSAARSSQRSTPPA